MDRIQATRYHRHYKFMEGVHPRGIMMSGFYGEMSSDRVEIVGADKPPKKQDASCGTAACVAGWLPVSSPRRWGNSNGLPRLRSRKARTSAGAFSDVAHYFGIAVIDTRYICDFSSYHNERSDRDDVREPTKASVLRHMRHVALAYGWDVTGNKPVKVKPRVSDSLATERVCIADA